MNGIERRLRIFFDVGTETVIDVLSAGCLDPATSTFEADAPVAMAAPPPWAGATGNGLAGSTLFEALGERHLETRDRVTRGSRGNRRLGRSTG